MAVKQQRNSMSISLPGRLVDLPCPLKHAGEKETQHKLSTSYLTCFLSRKRYFKMKVKMSLLAS